MKTLHKFEETATYSPQHLFTAGKRSHNLLTGIGFGNKVATITDKIKSSNTLNNDRN